MLAVSGTLRDVGLVLIFILVGSFFAGAEMALVSLRGSQAKALKGKSKSGDAVVRLNSDPNRFLAAVQVGVTLSGFLSAAFGGATLAGRLSPTLEDWGLPEGAADTTALVVITLLISYVSLVDRRARTQAARPATGRVVRPAVGADRRLHRQLARPIIWILSRSTDVVVRLLGGDPSAKRDRDHRR